MNDQELKQWQIESVAQAYAQLEADELAQWASYVHLGGE